MTNPEIIPEPEPDPLDSEVIIRGLEEAENKWGVPDLVSRFSPWVNNPELARDMFNHLCIEMKQKFDIDLLKYIKDLNTKTAEMTEHHTSRVKKLGEGTITAIRNLLR